MTRERNLKRGSEGSEGSAELLVVYDIGDAAGWETANRHRSLWGKTHTRIHYLEENVVVLVFRPARQERWRPWEGVRRAWIESELQGSEAA
jgi:hypothetical protein